LAPGHPVLDMNAGVLDALPESATITIVDSPIFGVLDRRPTWPCGRPRQGTSHDLERATHELGGRDREPLQAGPRGLVRRLRARIPEHAAPDDPVGHRDPARLGEAAQLRLRP